MGMRLKVKCIRSMVTVLDERSNEIRKSVLTLKLNCTSADKIDYKSNQAVINSFISFHLLDRHQQFLLVFSVTEKK